MGKRRRRVPRYLRNVEVKGRIPADPSQQVRGNSYDPPPVYYVDYEFTCVDCGKEDVWTAEQQKWWYEVAKGTLQSRAIRCRACRKARREAHGGTPRRSHADRLRQQNTKHPPGDRPKE